MENIQSLIPFFTQLRKTFSLTIIDKMEKNLTFACKFSTIAIYERRY